MTPAAETTTHHERYQPARLIMDTAMPLQPGTEYRVGSYAPAAEQPEVIAEITTDRSGVRDDEQTDRLVVIDLRSTPGDARGAKHYDGQLFDSSVQYLLIQPNLLDWEDGKGYKGLRREESYRHGRPDVRHIAAADPRHRFAGASDSTSRSHFNIRVDQNDRLWIDDCNSANGTFVAAGEAALARMTPEENTLAEAAPRLALARTALDRLELKAPDTKPGIGIPISEEVVAGLRELAYDKRQKQLTRELLTDKGLEPKVGVRLDDKEFYFSGVSESKNGRKYVIGYVKTEGNGVLLPRLFYKSHSDGGWRATPGLYGDGRVSKGDISDHGGYVQMTKPVESVAQMLEYVETHHPTDRALSGRDLYDYFSLYRQWKEGVESFSQEVTPQYLNDGESYYSLYESFSPGTGYVAPNAETARHRIKNMRLPQGFEPDFSAAPIKRFTANHSLAGKVGVAVYRADFRGTAINWHVMEDADGNVWLDKAALNDGKVTSYGTAQSVELLGALSAKPFDYPDQVKKMVAGVDYDSLPGSQYVDLRQKYWGRMPWVKRYKHAKNAR